MRLVDVERLFVRQGFDETSVADISERRDLLVAGSMPLEHLYTEAVRLAFERLSALPISHEGQLQC